MNVDRLAAFTDQAPVQIADAVEDAIGDAIELLGEVYLGEVLVGLSLAMASPILQWAALASNIDANQALDIWSRRIADAIEYLGRPNASTLIPRGGRLR